MRVCDCAICVVCRVYVCCFLFSFGAHAGVVETVFLRSSWYTRALLNSIVNACALQVRCFCLIYTSRKAPQQSHQHFRSKRAGCNGQRALKNAPLLLCGADNKQWGNNNNSSNASRRTKHRLTDARVKPKEAEQFAIDHDMDYCEFDVCDVPSVRMPFFALVYRIWMARQAAPVMSTRLQSTIRHVRVVDVVVSSCAVVYPSLSEFMI